MSAVVTVAVAVALLGSVLVVGSVALTGTSADVSSVAPTPSPRARPLSAGRSLATDPELRLRAARITSTFENATTVLQYGYAEDIGDGRGITAGRAGFTSATSDLLLVVRRYTLLRPDNILARYIPALEKVDGSDSTDGLDGFGAAWAKAAKDPVQRKVQDDVVDELYFEPALRLAKAAGVRTPLGQAIVWDTMIQHGDGGEDGTKVILDETVSAEGRVSGNERAWLDAFLDVRLRHLRHMYTDSPDDDSSSRSRINALRSLVSADRMTLALPLSWEVYGHRFTLG